MSQYDTESLTVFMISASNPVVTLTKQLELSYQSLILQEHWGGLALGTTRVKLEP